MIIGIYMVYNWGSSIDGIFYHKDQENCDINHWFHGWICPSRNKSYIKKKTFPCERIDKKKHKFSTDVCGRFSHPSHNLAKCKCRNWIQSLLCCFYCANWIVQQVLKDRVTCIFLSSNVCTNVQPYVKSTERATKICWFLYTETSEPITSWMNTYCRESNY